MARSNEVRANGRLPKLVEETFTETDPETGTPIQGTRFRRGVLVRETRNYSSAMAGFAAMANAPGVRTILENFCEYLRDQLEAQGLPSDRIRSWLKRRGGGWSPALEPIKIEPGIKYCLWNKLLEERTEPLTRERAAGELLEDLSRLLDQPGIDKHLWHIGQAMRSHLNYFLTGNFNKLATDAKTAALSRKNGPKALRERSMVTRDVIIEFTQAYWKRNPLYRGDASNTAVCIQQNVNERLVQRKLLGRGKSGLSVKTIADYIRAS